MIDHSSRAHALLSASGASRWLACTPSARFEEMFPDTTSDYAKEGTLAHELCEATLKEKMGEKGAIRKMVKTIKDEPLYSEEMLDHAEAYADYVLEKRKSKYAEVIVEERLDFSDYVPEGFGTGDCLILNGDTITVIDFKYGKGVEVSAENNPQMMLYGLGALKMFDFIYQFERVELCIFQPRISNVSEWEITVEQLAQWAKDTVVPKAQDAWNGKGEFVAGDHCLFCKGKAKCRALAKYSMEVVMEDFQNAEGDLEENLLDDSDISMILSRMATVRKWLTAVEEAALRDAFFNGKKIPGYKVVEGRSNRIIKDQDELVKVLTENGYDECLLYKRSLESITNLEKIVKKKQFNELVGHLIDKPQGKPTLVPLSDKREEWVKESDFSVIE